MLCLMSHMMWFNFNNPQIKIFKLWTCLPPCLLFDRTVVLVSTVTEDYHCVNDYDNSHVNTVPLNDTMQWLTAENTTTPLVLVKKRRKVAVTTITTLL